MFEAMRGLIWIPLLSFGTSGIDNDTALQQTLATRNPKLTNQSINSILALYPDDPFAGCPYGTGDGVVASGLQDKVRIAAFFLLSALTLT